MELNQLEALNIRKFDEKLGKTSIFYLQNRPQSKGHLTGIKGSRRALVVQGLPSIPISYYLRQMYSLPYFKEKDFAQVKQFMRENPFVVLAGCNADQGPVATHVPMLIEEKGEGIVLFGHIMRQTDHHQAFLQNPNVLAIFTGPHTYVSASWYSDPRQASTWNYITVHAKGVLRFLSESELPGILQRTTAHFENNEHSPSLFEKLPEEYVRRLAKSIIAFEIEVRSIDNVFKLSQNRDEKSYHNIIGQLKQGDAVSMEVASEMEQRSSHLFQQPGEQQRP